MKRSPTLSLESFPALARTGAALVLVVLLALLSARPSAACDVVNQWQPWETSIQVTNATNPLGNNPYRDFIIRVKLTNAGSGATFTQDAFWDNDPANSRIFKIRAALPAGNWTWGNLACTTVGGGACSPAPTWSATSGCMTVQSATTGTKLYDNGFLTQLLGLFSGGSTWGQLEYSNLQPFYWAGDTAWAAPPREIRNSAGTAQTAFWDTYLNSRAGTFTVTQIAPAVAYQSTPGHPFTSLPPAAGFSFAQNGSCTTPLPNACSKPIKSYWDQFDDLLRRANQKDIVVFIGGLIDPLDLGGSAAGSYPTVADAKNFARYLAARTSNRAVLLSPGFDDRISFTTADGQTVAASMQAVGLAAKAAAPNVPLTNHLGGASPCADYETFRTQGWMTFFAFQSGHGGSGQTSPNGTVCGSPYPSELPVVSAVRRSIEMPVGLSSAATSPRMSTYNAEGPYDPYPDADDPTVVDDRFQVRHVAYVTALSNALGFTYGNGRLGIWDNLSASVFTSSPSQADMVRFFAHFRQPRPILTSRSSWITNQPTGFDQKMALATDSGALIVAFLPGCQMTVPSPTCPPNAAITFTTSGIAGLGCGTWTGRWSKPYNNDPAIVDTSCSAAGGTLTYTKPACTPAIGAECDWVLEITKN